MDQHSRGELFNYSNRLPSSDKTLPSRALRSPSEFVRNPTTIVINAAPVVETRDVAALLQVSTSNATTILRHLAQKGMIVHLSRGRWLVNEKIDRPALPELISAPYSAYISLQSALFHHGLIEQIPSVIYAVTLTRPRRLRTPLGTISFHRMPPELFKGFELSSRSDAKVANPEKALFDLLYLAAGQQGHPWTEPPVQLLT